ERADAVRCEGLTTAPGVKRLERVSAAAINGKGQSNVNGNRHSVYAVAVNSGTAALHLAVEALGLKPGQGVLVPTMTFAATAEVVRYQGAIPILVDCDPVTLNMDLDDAARKGNGKSSTAKGPGFRASRVVGIMPVHVGGRLMDLGELERFATRNKLWVVEDAAHAFPSAWRSAANTKWQKRSNGSKSVTCYSF